MTRWTHGVLSSVLWMEGASADKLMLRRVTITSTRWGDGGDWGVQDKVVTCTQQTRRLADACKQFSARRLQ